MDEAMSSVKLKSISKPVELDIIEKEIRTFKIEYEAKKTDKTISKDVLNELEEKIKQKESEAKVIESAWKIEKEIINQVKNNREKIDKLKIEAGNFERE
jgi:ATP-dependent Clp protease ATP-binding subunit ClpB